MTRTFLLPRLTPHRQQRGAALFISLMILIILTLLGLSAAQVTTLQERMSAVYRSDQMAFERAESALSDIERDVSIEGAAKNVLCENLYDGARQVQQWKAGTNLATTSKVENLGRGAGFITRMGSLEAGIARELGSDNCLFLQISAHSYDDPAAKNAHAIVQSIFTP